MHDDVFVTYIFEQRGVAVIAGRVDFRNTRQQWPRNVRRIAQVIQVHTSSVTIRVTARTSHAAAHATPSTPRGVRRRVATVLVVLTRV